MVFDLVKATVLFSAVHVAVGGSTSQRNGVAAVKRHYGGQYSNSCDGSYASGCQNFPPNQGGDSYAPAPTGYDYAGGVKGCYAQNSGTDYNAYHAASGTHAVHAQVSQDATSHLRVDGAHASDGRVSTTAHVQASGSVSAMVQGWGSLTSGLNHLTATFSSGASVNVAIQAASSLQNQFQLVSRQYASCGCSPTAETRTTFNQMVLQFFFAMQHCLQTGQQYYGDRWSTSFSGIFQSYSVAFSSLKAIASSLQVDMTGTLQAAHVDAHLFASVGLNLSALLQVNLSTSGFVNI